jgi:hypothetical protein
LCVGGIFVVGLFSSAGRKYHRFTKFIIPLIFFSVLIFNMYRLSLTNFYLNSFVINVYDVKCFFIVMIFTVLCTGIVCKAVSKRIVFNPGVTGAIIGILSFSIGSFVIDMHCPLLAEEHITIYHTILPMLTGAFLGFVSGKIFFKL